VTGDVSEHDKMKVFVSYSRRDVAFADQIVYALEQQGFRPILDRHDIDAAEKWKDRLGKLILSADAVVFVLTENSAGSPICAWEIDEADRLAKRMIPVLPDPLPEGVARPEKLSDLNEIKFYHDPDLPGSGFAKGLFDLSASLKTNLAWVREHTELSEQAARWQSLGRSEDFLLRGEALEAAKTWQTETPPDSEIEPGIVAFLAASADYAEKLKREQDSQIEEREIALEKAKTATSRVRRAVFAGALGVLLFGCFAFGALWEAGMQTLRARVAQSDLYTSLAQEMWDRNETDLAYLYVLSADPAARGDLWFKIFGIGENTRALEKLATFLKSDTRLSSHTFDNPYRANSTGEFLVSRDAPTLRYDEINLEFVDAGRHLTNVAARSEAESIATIGLGVVTIPQSTGKYRHIHFPEGAGENLVWNHDFSAAAVVGRDRVAFAEPRSIENSDDSAFIETQLQLTGIEVSIDQILRGLEANRAQAIPNFDETRFKHPDDLSLGTLFSRDQIYALPHAVQHISFCSRQTHIDGQCIGVLGILPKNELVILIGSSIFKVNSEGAIVAEDHVSLSEARGTGEIQHIPTLSKVIIQITLSRDLNKRFEFIEFDFSASTGEWLEKKTIGITTVNYIDRYRQIYCGSKSGSLGVMCYSASAGWTRQWILSGRFRNDSPREFKVLDFDTENCRIAIEAPANQRLIEGCGRGIIDDSTPVIRLARLQRLSSLVDGTNRFLVTDLSKDPTAIIMHQVKEALNESAEPERSTDADLDFTSNVDPFPELGLVSEEFGTMWEFVNQDQTANYAVYGAWDFATNPRSSLTVFDVRSGQEIPVKDSRGFNSLVDGGFELHTKVLPQNLLLIEGKHSVLVYDFQERKVVFEYRTKDPVHAHSVNVSVIGSKLIVTQNYNQRTVRGGVYVEDGRFAMFDLENLHNAERIFEETSISTFRFNESAHNLEIFVPGERHLVSLDDLSSQKILKAPKSILRDVSYSEKNHRYAFISDSELFVTYRGNPTRWVTFPARGFSRVRLGETDLEVYLNNQRFVIPGQYFGDSKSLVDHACDRLLKLGSVEYWKEMNTSIPDEYGLPLNLSQIDCFKKF
tara:strand:- start:9386 stop:12655 length:3270 start_codon:yes stop_codon:yes gene_type:complete